MDTNRGEFQDFHHTIDGVMKKTDRSGIGVEKRQAQPFTREDEGQLWDKVFSIDNAQNLSYAVYFYVSKVFALRASDEHNNLQAEQFVFGTDKEGEFVEFHGRPCKNNQGGFYNSRKVPYKNIRQYSDPSNPRCVVKLLKNYLGLIPSKGAFYRRPLPKKTTTNAIKFSSQKIGINTIRQYTKKMCEIAGIDGYHTGHSGKVTAATSLYKQGFDEQLIKERTGHRSDDGLRAYKRTCSSLQKNVSDALQPPKPPDPNADDEDAAFAFAAASATNVAVISRQPTDTASVEAQVSGDGDKCASDDICISIQKGSKTVTITM
ncbi:uncharacterized protein [Ptychodera flava]|uniref:uncharacterized protein n=2 Tax=Ptychodera flava TaxID=63121 RepID=UPI00396A1D0E